MDTIGPIVHFIMGNITGHLDMVDYPIKDMVSHLVKVIVSNYIIIEDIGDILIGDTISHIIVED